jgi:Kelch motif/Galactose oxidase, central domain
MPQWAYQASVTMLSDGRVLVAGGWKPAPTGGPYVPISDAYIFDPMTGAQEKVGPMLNARWGHTATTLPNGKVLIVGGADSYGTGWPKPVYAPAELFDPSKKAFSMVGFINFARLSHNAVGLWNGDVLIIGGDNGTDRRPGPELFVGQGPTLGRRRVVRR